ncbi:MAG TPA: AbrB/MazE/SpoVT family DNA-binding domain-containing protein [Candidatus Acidoferrales bacterium]|nr:AbrB/MazE/SpoVT family DNA-binding domain-containing protein [Candidatus Acidoferrales bacterium]
MARQVEVGLRKKNQLTLPEELAKVLDVRAGSRLIMQFDPEEGVITLRPLRDSYAGILRGVYGTSAEAAAYGEEERGSWDAE